MVDALDNPVMALSFSYYGDYLNLWLTYPASRVGGLDWLWEWQKLDGRDIDTAYALDFDLSDSGLGLIAYIEKEEYHNKLKIAYQVGYSVYLPKIDR